MSNIRTVEIPFEKIKKPNWQETFYASSFGIELVQWCKDQGLLIYKDFEWRCDTGNKKLVFRFFEGAGNIPTMFMLKFGGGNV